MQNSILVSLKTAFQSENHNHAFPGRLLFGLVVVLSLCSAVLQAQSGPLPQLSVQLPTRVVQPGEAIRGRIIVDIAGLAQPAAARLVGACFNMTGDGAPGRDFIDYVAESTLSGGLLHGSASALAVDGVSGRTAHSFTAANGTTMFNFGRELPLRAPATPGEYLLVLAVTGGTLSPAMEWVRITVTDKQKRILVDDSEFSPYPPTKGQPSMLALRFTVEGIPTGAPGPGQVTVDVKLERIGMPDEKGQIPWRIGFKHYDDLRRNPDGKAAGTCNVRLTPLEATRYRLRYTVSCVGYESGEGLVLYPVRDPSRGPAPALNPDAIEWVRSGSPEIIRREWGADVPGVKMVGTAAALGLEMNRDDCKEHTVVSWDEPPAVIKRGQRVSLSIRRSTKSKCANLGAKWIILCDHAQRQGAEFLSSFESPNDATLSAVVNPALDGPAPAEPVRMFWMDAGPWNHNTHLNVYWRYLPRVAGSAGPIPADELPNLPTNAGSSPQGTSPAPSGPGGPAGPPTAPPKPGSGGVGGGGGVTSGSGGGTPPPTPGKPGTKPPAAVKNFSGNWTPTYGADWGEIRLQQTGNRITGSYEGAGGGTLEGTVVEGRIALLRWVARNTPNWGGAKFTLSEDGNTLTGSRNDWKDPDVAQFRWDAKRIIQ